MSRNEKKFVIILLHSLAKQKTDPEKPEESRDSKLNLHPHGYQVQEHFYISFSPYFFSFSLSETICQSRMYKL
jgi:hypothetical protein